MSSFFSGMACSVCFGDPNSLQSKGLLLGVFFLMGIIVLVLGAIASTALAWARRARKLGQESR